MSEDNRYSPPQAELRDPGPARLVAKRPREVVQATIMLWISLALGLLRTYLELRRDGESWTGALALWGIVVLIAIPVNVAIWRGRNWARLLYAGLTFLAVALFPLSVASEPATGSAPAPIEHAVQAIEFALDLGIVFLLLTKPGSLWFRFAR